MGPLNVQIFNSGVVSQNSSQELIRIITEMADYHPTLIVAYNGGNDIMDPFFWDPRPGYPYNFMVYENNPLLNAELVNSPVWSLFGLGSFVLRHLFFSYYRDRFFNLSELRRKADYQSNLWREAIADVYVNNLGKAHISSRAFGTTYIAFFSTPNLLLFDSFHRIG